VLVSGNFFNVDPQYLALADDVDLVITEMRNTTYRQPEWFRYVAAFAGEKDVLVVENPYGGVVPELVDKLHRGRGHDLFRLSIYEGAAFGASMTAPYGSWMGATIQDSFYAPHDVVVEVQSFLADHDDLFSKQTCNDVAVVFSVESTRALISRQDQSDNIHNARDESVHVPYRVVTQRLASSHVPFDVVIFPDGVTADDRVESSTFDRYGTVILPSCGFLTTRQAGVLRDFLDAGGQVVVTGDFAENLNWDDRAGLAQHVGMHGGTDLDLSQLLPSGGQVVIHADCGVNIHRLANGSPAVHLVNYDYQEERDRVLHVENVDLDVRFDRHWPKATAYGSDGRVWQQHVGAHEGRQRVRLPVLGLYTIVVFHDGDR
jgi:hypothetical protein